MIQRSGLPPSRFKKARALVIPSSIVNARASKRQPAKRVGSAERLTPQKLSLDAGEVVGNHAANPDNARNELVLVAPVAGKSPRIVMYAIPVPIAQLASKAATLAPVEIVIASPVITPVERFTAVTLTAVNPIAPPSVAEATSNIPTSKATID